MSEPTKSPGQDRAEAIEALRRVLDVLEADPNVPVPSTLVWSFGAFEGTQEWRYNRAHDVADAFGLTVTEGENGRRTAAGKSGPLSLFGYAYADPRPAEPPARPRVVQRPARVEGAEVAR